MAENNFGHELPPYNYAMSQLGHEMGHRDGRHLFGRRSTGKTLFLVLFTGREGLQAPVKFPYQRSVEASAMGGGVWQENPDGTYTQLDDDYYVPATGIPILTCI
jgi:hypothetical protein